MSFFYCRDDGDATGDGGRYTSEKANNSWDTEFSATSEYYDSVESALAATTPPVNGDVILVSSASTFDKGSTVTLTIATVPTQPVSVYSVNDSSINNYLVGAEDSAASGSGDYTITKAGLLLQYSGITVRVDDDLTPNAENTGFIFVDSEIVLGGIGDKIRLFRDGSTVDLTNTDIVMTGGTNTRILEITSGAVFQMCGGSTSTTSGTLDDLIGVSGTSGGMTAIFTGVDLSAHGAGAFLLSSTGGSRLDDDMINVRIHQCAINGSVGYVEEEFSSPIHTFLMANSSSDSAAAEYQFYQRTWAGDVEDQDDSGIHRDESIPYSSGTKASWEVTTNSECSAGRPLVVDLPFRFAELSNASSDTIRVYFAQPDTQPNLTNANCWAEIYYPDGTTKNQWNNASNRVSDILSAGTEHTDDSGSSTWLDGASALTGYDEYRMDIDTSGDPGADSVPRVRIFITEPSATIYFDTTVDSVA